LKEVNYHLGWSRDWVLRLGDGTPESHARMIKALDYLWNFTGELFEPITGELFDIDYTTIKESWLKQIQKTLEEATLEFPQDMPFQTGGLKGIHTEYLGYLLADMQWMQRVYPNSEW
jgi:ring-1,2-phenylacetyl-CoA epoxidase subunit PaaC